LQVNCKEGKETIMPDNKFDETTRNAIKTLSETNQTLLSNAVAAQERNIAFSRSILEDGVEVLKRHAESNRALMRELAEQSKKQSAPAALQVLVEKTIQAQERNTQYAQSVFENGINVLKSQAEIAHKMMQDLGQQTQKQQEAFQSLMHESVNAYMDFFRMPFTYYQQALEAAETATRQSLESFQKATQQSLENIQHVTQEAQRRAKSAKKATE